MLWEKGWAVIRGPASGGGSKARIQPDIVAVKNRKILVFEVKKARSKPVYLDPGQVLGLIEWARRAGGDAWIAVRIAGDGWRFHMATQLSTTRRGGLKIADPRKGMKFRDLINQYEGSVERIDKYL